MKRDLVFLSRFLLLSYFQVVPYAISFVSCMKYTSVFSSLSGCLISYFMSLMLWPMFIVAFKVIYKVRLIIPLSDMS